MDYSWGGEISKSKGTFVIGVYPTVAYCKSFFNFFSLILIFFHYSWFTVFCQFCTVQHSDPVTHTSIQSFFSNYHAPS